MTLPEYGTVTERIEDMSGNASIIRDGYHGNQPRTHKIWFEESKLIGSKETLLEQLLSGLDDFLSGKVKELDFEIRSTQTESIRLVKRTLVK
jgi:hypothetical protein